MLLLFFSRVFCWLVVLFRLCLDFSRFAQFFCLLLFRSACLVSSFWGAICYISCCSRKLSFSQFLYFTFRLFFRVCLSCCYLLLSCLFSVQCTHTHMYLCVFALKAHFLARHIQIHRLRTENRNMHNKQISPYSIVSC